MSQQTSTRAMGEAKILIDGGNSPWLSAHNDDSQHMHNVNPVAATVNQPFLGWLVEAFL